MTEAERIEELVTKNRELQRRLQEAEEILSAIRDDQIDAVVVLGPEGNQVQLLRRDSRSYRILVDIIGEGAVLMTQDGSVFSCNTRFGEMVGIRAGTITGSSMLSFIPEQDQERFSALVNGTANGISKGEIRLKKGDGALLPVHLAANRFNMEDAPGICLVMTDLSERKKNESALASKTNELHVKSQHLEEVNTALKILLKQREEDKTEFEEHILSNVKYLVLPYLEKLRGTNLTDEQATYCEILESHMNEIVSPFVRTLSRSFSTLTAMEIQVANLVKDGKSTKEIAALLKVSENTVIVHRHRIRTKLGLKRTKANLSSHLQSLGV